MKSKIAILFISFLLIFSDIYSQITPGYNWFKKAGGTGKEFGHALSVTASGDIYITGEFEKTITFDPGTTITSNGNVDYFLAKYNNTGDAVWVKRAGSTLTDRGFAVTADDNNVYVSGEYFGTTQFENITVASSGNLDGFIGKYDASGNLLWLKEVKDELLSTCRAISLDAFRNIIVAGYYGGPTVTFGDKQITNNGERDVFIAKYNQSGDVLWVNSVGGPAGSEEGEAVACDALGNIYLGGNVADSALFGAVLTRSFGKNDAFLAKYDADGSLLWVKTAGGIGEDAVKGLALDNNGDVYVTGFFDSSATFGTSTLTGTDNSDIFIAKYNSTGDLLWARQASGSKVDYGYSITANSQGCFVTGKFTGTTTFGMVDIASINGSDDIFIAHYDASGNFVWMKQIGGTDTDWGRAITSDHVGNLYVSGSFKATASFDNGNTLQSSGVEDVFIAKLGNAVVPVELASFNYSVENGSIKLEWTTVSELNNDTYEIERSKDGVSFMTIGYVKGSGTTSEKHSYSFIDMNISSNIYYYRLKQIDYNGTSTYSKFLKADIEIPSQFVLHQNYPNPFNPETMIKFELPSDADVSLRIFNLIGQEVAAPILNKFYSRGVYSVSFNSGLLSSGVYLYCLKADGINGNVLTATRKMTIVK